MTAHPDPMARAGAAVGALRRDSRRRRVTAPDQFRPAILRFASDDFMDQLHRRRSARDPARIGDLLARPETWRTPAGRAEPIWSSACRCRSVAQSRAPDAHLRAERPRSRPVAATADVSEKAQHVTLPLKLYQPAHQRYYLVGASLVCGVAGLPERARGDRRQRAGRLRVAPAVAADAGEHGDARLREFAFVKDAHGARWRRVADGDDGAQLAPGEELLPLFPLTYRDDAAASAHAVDRADPGRHGARSTSAPPSIARPRRLRIGQLQSLQPPSAPAPTASMTARMTQFKLEVAEPWKNLVRASYDGGAVDSMTATGRAEPATTPQTRARARAEPAVAACSRGSFCSISPITSRRICPTSGRRSQTRHRQRQPCSSAAKQSSTTWLGHGNDERRPHRGAARRQRSASRLDIAARCAAGRSVGARRVWSRDRRSSIRRQSSVSDADWPDFHFLLAGLDTAFAAGRCIHGARLAAAAASTDEVEPDASSGAR